LNYKIPLVLKKIPQVLFILLVLLNSYFVESQQKPLKFIIEPLIVPTLFIYH